MIAEAAFVKPFFLSFIFSIRFLITRKLGSPGGDININYRQYIFSLSVMKTPEAVSYAVSSFPRNLICQKIMGRGKIWDWRAKKTKWNKTRHEFMLAKCWRIKEWDNFLCSNEMEWQNRQKKELHMKVDRLDNKTEKEWKTENGD